MGARPAVDHPLRRLDVPQLALRGDDDVLVWLYLRRNDGFYFVRNMFMVAMGFALVGYSLYPTAPPRFMPEWGFTDSVAAFIGVRVENSRQRALNPYAAVPEHARRFALMVAVPRAAARAEPRPLKVVWLLYPLLVTFVVVVDRQPLLVRRRPRRAGGRGSASAASYAFARARPEAWSWRAPAKARVSDGARAARPRAAATAASGRRRRQMRAVVRNRLIESRLTPNAISLTGLVGNLVAAVLVSQE